MALDFADFPCCFKLFAAGGNYLEMARCRSVVLGNAADGRTQAGGVVMGDEVAGGAFGIGEGERGFRTDGLFFERAVATLQPAVVSQTGADSSLDRFRSESFRPACAAV